MKYSLNKAKRFTHHLLLVNFTLHSLLFTRYSCCFFSEADAEISIKQIFIRPTGPMTYTGCKNV